MRKSFLCTIFIVFILVIGTIYANLTIDESKIPTILPVSNLEIIGFHTDGSQDPIDILSLGPDDINFTYSDGDERSSKYPIGDRLDIKCQIGTTELSLVLNIDRNIINTGTTIFVNGELVNEKPSYFSYHGTFISNAGNPGYSSLTVVPTEDGVSVNGIISYDSDIYNIDSVSVHKTSLDMEKNDILYELKEEQYKIASYTTNGDSTLDHHLEAVEGLNYALDINKRERARLDKSELSSGLLSYKVSELQNTSETPLECEDLIFDRKAPRQNNGQSMSTLSSQAPTTLPSSHRHQLGIVKFNPLSKLRRMGTSQTTDDHNNNNNANLSNDHDHDEHDHDDILDSLLSQTAEAMEGSDLGRSPKLTRWTQCHPRSKNRLTTVTVNLLVTYGVSVLLTGRQHPTQEAVLATITALVANSNGPLRAQLGIQLSLANVWIMTEPGVDKVSWNYGVPSDAQRGYCPSAASVINTLQNIRSDPNFPAAAITHMLTACYTEGLLGQGYVGGARHKTYSVSWSSLRSTTSWITFTHEIGHNLGGKHPFKNSADAGRYGGLMDYGTREGVLTRGPYVGQVGFNIDVDYTPLCEFLELDLWEEDSQYFFSAKDSFIFSDGGWLCAPPKMTHDSILADLGLSKTDLTLPSTVSSWITNAENTLIYDMNTGQIMPVAAGGSNIHLADETQFGQNNNNMLDIKSTPLVWMDPSTSSKWSKYWSLLESSLTSCDDTETFKGCSTGCGTGTETRTPLCTIAVLNANDLKPLLPTTTTTTTTMATSPVYFGGYTPQRLIVDDAICAKTVSKPISERKCSATTSCEVYTYTWKCSPDPFPSETDHLDLLSLPDCNVNTETSWGECDTSCGDGMKYRHVRCISSDNTIVSDSLCAGDIPDNEMACTADTGCVYAWQCAFSTVKNYQQADSTNHGSCDNNVWFLPQFDPLVIESYMSHLYDSMTSGQSSPASTVSFQDYILEHYTTIAQSSYSSAASSSSSSTPVNTMSTSASTSTTASDSDDSDDGERYALEGQEAPQSLPVIKATEIDSYCPNTCGSATLTRSRVCTLDGTPMPPTKCSHLSAPSLSRTCRGTDGCTYSWKCSQRSSTKSSDYSNCVDNDNDPQWTTCEKAFSNDPGLPEPCFGEKTRDVQCFRSDGTMVEPEKCTTSTKPNGLQHCDIGSCEIDSNGESETVEPTEEEPPTQSGHEGGGDSEDPTEPHTTEEEQPTTDDETDDTGSTHPPDDETGEEEEPSTSTVPGGSGGNDGDDDTNEGQAGGENSPPEEETPPKQPNSSPGPYDDNQVATLVGVNVLGAAAIGMYLFLQYSNI